MFKEYKHHTAPTNQAQFTENITKNGKFYQNKY